MQSWQSKILTLEELSTHFTLVEIERPKDYVFTYGQYAELIPQVNKNRYLALASAPQDTTIKLLVVTEKGVWDFTKPITLGPALGGFAKALETKQDLLLVTHGIGIAALLGLLKDKQRGILPHNVCCLWGLRFQKELKILTHYGVNLEFIQPSFSRDTGSLRGYVQVHLKTFYRPGMGVLLVGSKQMISEVKGILLGLGTPAEDIFLNF